LLKGRPQRGDGGLRAFDVPAKSHRSVCEYRSSSPVILPVATSSSSDLAPLARSSGDSFAAAALVAIAFTSVMSWSATGAGLGDVTRLPEILFQSVEAGELGARHNGVLVAVDLWIKIAEDRGDRLDALPVGAGHRVDLLGLGTAAGLQRTQDPPRGPGNRLHLVGVSQVVGLGGRGTVQ
jgi:hypothetical protein